MTAADVDPAEVLWREAFADMRARGGFAPRPHDASHAERVRRRLRYVLAGDPGGSWVATAGPDLVGVVQALQRGRLWVLSLLAVAVRVQGRGIGRRLLDQAMAYAPPESAGLILSSSDPRALRRYVAAGFSLHPVVAGTGRVRRDRVPLATEVRPGSAHDLGLAAEVDERVRGVRREGDLAHLLDDGAELLVVDRRGFALARGSQPLLLAATDEAAARELLAAVLASGPPEQEVEVGWLGGAQQWAIEVAVAAGLEVRLSGAIMVRGLRAPPRPYIANGAVG